MSSPNQETLMIAGSRDSILSGRSMFARISGGIVKHQHVLFTFATSMTMFAAFAIQGIILANILGREGRGEYASTVFFPQALLYVGLLGAIEIVAWYARQSGTDILRLRRAAFKLSLVTGGLALLAVVVLSLTSVPDSKQHLIPLCLLCSLAIPFQHIQLITISVDRGSDQLGRYNLIRLFGSLLLPGILLGFWLTGTGSLELICVMFVVAAIVSAIPCFWKMEGALSPSKPTAGKLLKDGKSYSASMFASELFERLDIALFFWLTTLGTQGCYAAIVPAAHLLIIIPNALGVFTFNIGADPDREVTVRETTTALSITFVVQLVATIAFTAIIGWLVMLFFGEDFRPAIPLVYALIPAISIKGFLQAVEGYLKGRGKAHIGTRARLVGVAIMLLFVWLTFGKFQHEGLSIPLGACVAQLLCMICIVVAVYVDVIERNRGVKSVDGDGGQSA